MPGISRTAIWVAAARAIGAREPDPAASNPDVLAERLLGDPATLELRHPVIDALQASYEAAMQDIEVAELVRAMTIRTRFIDEALERAVHDGATQVLVLGAGLDSHAYRCRELLAATRIFEVDRPATLDFKQRQVTAALGGAPANLAYVPLDLGEDLAASLARHGHERSRRTFVIMEGVTMYLPPEALRSTLGFVAAHASGTRIVFDFATQATIESLRHIDLATVPTAARASFERFLDLIRDEPWLSGLRPGGEQEYLASLGLELGELLQIGSEESAARYLTRADGTTVGADAHARAVAMRRGALEKMLALLGPEQRQKMEERMREMERQSAYWIAEAAVPLRH